MLLGLLYLYGVMYLDAFDEDNHEDSQNGVGIIHLSFNECADVAVVG